MNKLNIKKTACIVITAVVVFMCLFNNTAFAKSKVVGKKNVSGKQIKKNKTWGKDHAKKKIRGKKRKHVIGNSIEERKAALKLTFLKAGISQEEIDDIFTDERIELYYNIYAPPILKEGEERKKKLSYFDEEFGLCKPESIESGRKIIADNKELFDNIESTYGVPANYIIAIIRVETNFKEHLGKYGVFNALYTMSILGKRVKRVEMAHRELAIWVKMCKQRGIDPFDMKGSWAGAFGIPQFMPSSYVKFAMDCNDDGKIDLYDYPDTFVSIAHYLHHMGWETGDVRKMRRAIYFYNHETAYVDAVFAYAERL